MVMVLTGVAVGAAAGGPAHGATGAAGAAGCTTGRLKVFLGGGPGGAAGSVYLGMHFVNKSTTRCSLTGFPGVSFVDAQHHQVGAAAQRTTPPSAHRVTLAPGSQASVILRVTQTANYPSATCRPKAVRGLRVYPPGQTRSTFVPARRAVCSSRTIRQLSVTPLVAGAPQS
jgi:hypothetical protein